MATPSIFKGKDKIFGLLALVGMFAVPTHAHALTASEIFVRFCEGGEKLLVNTFDDHEDAEGCTAEDCSLREAVNAANLCPLGKPGNVQLRNGTYALNHAGFDAYLPIKGDVRIYGGSATTIKPHDTESLTGPAFSIANQAKLNLRKNLTIKNFRSYDGAITVAHGGYLVLNRVTLRENAGARVIYNAGDTRIVKSSLTENVPSNSSVIYNSGLLKISYSTISNNDADVCVVDNEVFYSGKVVVQYSTISGNHHGSGTICASKDTDTRIVDSTIVDNHAVDSWGTGGVRASPGRRELFALEISNSIIANNTPSDCRFTDPGRVSATSKGTNLDSDGSCAAIPELNFTLSMDPMLDSLAYNKGPNQTHMPVWGSPVIDAGDTCNGRDQVSRERPVDGNLDSISRCDIGAMEFQPDYGLFKEVTLSQYCTGINAIDSWNSYCEEADTNK